MEAMEESSPPMVAGSGRISVFLDLRRLSSRDAPEAFIYGGFRSREPSGAFDGRLRRLEAKDGMGGAPREGARHQGHLFLPGSVCVIPKLSSSYSGK